MVINKYKHLLPLRFAARRFGLPVEWLREQAEQKKIPSLVAGKQIIFDVNILGRWLAERTKGEHD